MRIFRRILLFHRMNRLFFLQKNLSTINLSMSHHCSKFEVSDWAGSKVMREAAFLFDQDGLNIKFSVSWPIDLWVTNLDVIFNEKSKNAKIFPLSCMVAEKNGFSSSGAVILSLITPQAMSECTKQILDIFSMYTENFKPKSCVSQKL